MAFNYKPMSEQEITANRRFFSEGEANFQFLRSTEKNTQAGEPMVVLELQLWDKAGKTGAASKYITESMSFQLKEFLAAIGREDDYNHPPFEGSRYNGKTGKCNLRYRADKKTGKEFLEIGFIPVGIKTVPTPRTAGAPAFDDDINF